MPGLQGKSVRMASRRRALARVGSKEQRLEVRSYRFERESKVPRCAKEKLTSGRSGRTLGSFSIPDSQALHGLEPGFLFLLGKFFKVMAGDLRKAVSSLAFFGESCLGGHSEMMPRITVRKSRSFERFSCIGGAEGSPTAAGKGTR